MAVDVIQDTQKKGGTYRQQLAELMVDFSKLVENGGGNRETFERMLGHLLKSFEGVRINTESQIRKLKTDLAVQEATLRSCTTFSNMLVGLVKTYANEAAGKETNNIFTQTVRFVENADGSNGESEKPKRISDVEMRKKLCKCCCVDEEDAANCDCKCHTEGNCGDPECAVCASGGPVILLKKEPPKRKRVGKKAVKKKVK